MPLQVGIPGGPELLIVLFLFVIALVVPAVVAVFIYRDANDRDSDHALAWGAAALLSGFAGGIFAGIVVWVLYYVVRDEVGQPAGGPA